MSQTKVAHCNCKHGIHSQNTDSVKYQEKIYGSGNRLFIKSERNNGYVCSICGKSMTLSSK